MPTLLKLALSATTCAKTGNNYQPGDGIVGKDVEETLANVGTLAKKGMEKTNEVIIDIMIKE